MLDRFCSCRIAAMTGLDPHTQVVIILLPSVVFNLEEDPVKQSGFVAVQQLWKDTCSSCRSVGSVRGELLSRSFPLTYLL